MILNRPDHDPVLQFRRDHLHPARQTNARMGNIPIAGNLIRGMFNSRGRTVRGRRHDY